MKLERRTERSCAWLWGVLSSMLMAWILALEVKIKLWIAASRHETSNMENAQAEVVPSSGPADVAERIQELEDKLWKKINCVKGVIGRMDSQLMQFNEDIQKNGKIINGLKKKFKVLKHERAEDGVKDISSRTGTLKEQFDVLRLLGSGAFGKVFLVRKKGGADDGRLYAMKVLQKSSIILDDSPAQAMTERLVLEEVRHHPFLSTIHYAFQTDSKLFLVLHYECGGNLRSKSWERKFTEDEARIYISEMILALEHLHKRGIIHRDVKLENILLDSDGHAVLSDFGISKMFLPYEQHQAHTYRGTLGYMAPEIIERSEAGYDMAVDWWSLGIVIHELLTGGSPFETPGVSYTREEIIHRLAETEPCIQNDLSIHAKDFISKLLDKDPRKRLGGGNGGAEELKRHPFLNGINWSDLEQKKMSAPFASQETNESDVGNFTNVNTQMTLSNLLDGQFSNCDDMFWGYSYVSPSVHCS